MSVSRHTPFKQVADQNSLKFPNSQFDNRFSPEHKIANMLNKFQTKNRKPVHNHKMSGNINIKDHLLPDLNKTS